MMTGFRLFARGILLALAAFMITGCGFHLRGVADTPTWLTNVAIIIQQGHRSLEHLLKEQLQSYSIDVNPSIEKATYWIIIEHDDFDQHITSVSSSTTPRQYQLIYTVRFKLQRARSKEIIPLSQIVVSRQITINSDRILGSTDEEDHLKSEMMRDAMIQLLNRVNRSAPLPLPETHKKRSLP